MPKIKPSLESCLDEPISFYNGEVHLRFAKDPYHEYYLVGQDGALEKVDGVTGVSGIMDKSHYLKPWAVRVTADKLLQITPSDADELGNKLVSPILWSEFEEIVKRAKKAHTEHFEQAGDVGTRAHEIIENLIKHFIKDYKGKAYDCRGWYDYTSEDERVVNCVRAALTWMLEHQVTFLKTEHKVYSRIHNYAGTMDGKALVHACTQSKCCARDFHNELSIVDWKSSNQLSNEMLLQTAAYQNAEQEEFGEKIDARWILRLGKESGEFEPWYEKDFEGDFKAFKICLDLKRQMRYIEHRMSEAKKARTARKRAKGN